MQINKIPKISPDTGRKIYDVEIMSAEHVNSICRNAKLAFESWKKTSVKERQSYLKKLINIIINNKDNIIQTIIQDVGKPFCEAETEVIESCDILEYYCQEDLEGIDSPLEIEINKDVWPYKKVYGLYQPCGVYAVIKPWNYPFELNIWAIAPLLLAGNTIVYKPSELSTATGILLAELIHQAGFPKNVFNIIQGNGHTGKSLVENKDICGISFTGSSQVGKEIFENCKKLGVKLSLEMGGSDFALVLNDSIDEITLPGLLWGSFSNAGQVCVAIEKILISDEIYDSFIEKVVSETKKLKLKTEIPPIISKKQYLYAQSVIDEAIKHGGRLLCGGIPTDNKSLKSGNYMLPTIIECNDYDYLSSVNEIFAPIILVAPFNKEIEAAKIINASQYGLGCSIWTGDYKKHIALYQELDVGMLWINEVNLPMPQVPWIGKKESGVGFNLSKKAIYDAMNFKVIHIDCDTNKRPWWYPYIQE